MAKNMENSEMVALVTKLTTLVADGQLTANECRSPTPTSACARAGASLVPSPRKSTTTRANFGSYRAQRLVRGRREGPFVKLLSHPPTATPTRKVPRYVRTTNMFMAHSGPAKVGHGSRREFSTVLIKCASHFSFKLRRCA